MLWIIYSMWCERFPRWKTEQGDGERVQKIAKPLFWRWAESNVKTRVSWTAKLPNTGQVLTWVTEFIFWKQRILEQEESERLRSQPYPFLLTGGIEAQRGEGRERCILTQAVFCLYHPPSGSGLITKYLFHPIYSCELHALLCAYKTLKHSSSIHSTNDWACVVCQVLF